MTMNQFAMVEELAFLVKDNLPSKHLILSMEETLVNFLQDEASSDGILELEPMDSYNRLLLHLADIFGFAHVSVGEGVNRHLILERCQETSIPSILVSDILLEYDEPQISTISRQLLRRTGNSAVGVTKSPLQHSLEERETTYLAARERIFTTHLEEEECVKQKPRSDPIVARRMIAHALGQRIKSCEDPCVEAKDSKQSDSTVEAVKKTTAHSGQFMISHNDVDINRKPIVSSTKMTGDKSSKATQPHGGRNGNCLSDEYLKREHMGAAKRMSTQALGKHCMKSAERTIGE